MTRSAAQMLQLAPAVLIVLGGLAAATAQIAAPHDPRRLAAIYPPWWNSDTTLRAASQAGSVIGFGGLPFIVAVTVDSLDISNALHATGAIFVVDASLAPLCISPSQRASDNVRS